MGSILTIKLRNKEDDREIICNVDQDVELCKGDWEVVAPKGDEVQAKTIDDLENADQLEAEEAAGDQEVPEPVDTEGLKVALFLQEATIIRLNTANSLIFNAVIFMDFIVLF